MIRVMLVDDSSLYRGLLRTVLDADPEIEIVSQAVNGRLALPRIRYYNPDIIILDQEMPEMTGLETLEVIRKDFPDVGCIFFCAQTEEGARNAMKALELGALDFITKPEQKDGDPREFIRQVLIPQIKALYDKGSHDVQEMARTVSAPVTSTRDVQTSPPVGLQDRIICAIGISTGGPTALRSLLSHIPGNIRGSLLIVQHMPPLFTKQLAESLDRISTLKVVEAEHGMLVEPGHAYIAPGGKHLLADANATTKIKISDDPSELNCKPSVNVLFRSVAKCCGKRSIGVIMTGMGNDGYEGIKELKNAGSYLLAQSEASCLVYGMPQRPTDEKLVHKILDIEGIATEITRMMGGVGNEVRSQKA